MQAERHRKHSLDEDARILMTRLLPAFGFDLPVRMLTAAAVGSVSRAR